MYTFKATIIGLSVSLALCSINVRRSGWLDRVVEYQKKRFIDDLMKEPVKISARIEKAPPGYVDSKDWDYDSVMRLLTLIRESEGAAPVRRAFRRAKKTNRRFLSFAETFKVFPRVIKDNRNDFHYVDSGEYYADLSSNEIKMKLDPNDVIVVTNPVEAKLPNARISLDLLKRILERRAEAGRVMPTKPLNISWPVTPKKSTIKSTTSAEESTLEASPEPGSSAEGETTATPQTNDTTTASGSGNENDTTTTSGTGNENETTTTNGSANENETTTPNGSANENETTTTNGSANESETTTPNGSGNENETPTTEGT